MTLLKIFNLRKTYVVGKNLTIEALQDVSFAVDKKDFMAIAGPSGSGKSSLLHLLGGLDAPSSGSIIYQDEDIAQMSPDKLSRFRLYKIGFIFQAYNLIPTLTALENVEYIMLLQGIPAFERRDRSEAILKRVGLSSHIHRFPQEMSGGQQQRVAAARAIVAQPEIILADEPTANLDSKTAEALIQLLLELNEEKGLTFIFSTHDKTIMDKAKRLINLKDGKIV